MNKFDRICGYITIPFGAIFMILGFIGLFTGSSAHFRLPPILGSLPFFVGWGMCVTMVKALKKKPQSPYRKSNPRS